MASYHDDSRSRFDRSFETFDALLECADAPGWQRNRSSRRHGMSDWAGTPDWETAIRQARYGWPEGLARMSEMAARLERAVAQRARSRQEVFWDVAGSVVDVGRFVTGDPENMMEFEPQPQDARGRIFVLKVNLSASASVDSKVLFWRGAAIMGLTDLLEKNGFSVEIQGCEAVHSGGLRYVVRFPVKAAGAMLDQDRLAFALASPSMLRRVLFAVEENESPAIVERMGFNCGGGYGCPADDDAPSGEDNGIVLPSLKGWERNFRDLDGATDWVIERARAVLGAELVPGGGE